MKTIKILFPLALLLIALVGCNKIPVGYLNVDKAEFIPSVVEFYHTPNESTKRSTDPSIPWTTVTIQGITGTNPINYEFASVKVSDGGDQGKFLTMQSAGHLKVDGGRIVITQEGIKMLPIGNYILSLRVFNEGYSELLEDVLTIKVGDIEPTPEESPYY